MLQQAVTWGVGDEIAIASTGTRHSQSENEVAKIAAVSADGRTLTLEVRFFEITLFKLYFHSNIFSMIVFSLCNLLLKSFVN